VAHVAHLEQVQPELASRVWVQAPRLQLALPQQGPRELVLEPASAWALRVQLVLIAQLTPPGQLLQPPLP
jgi:hypothetical protein